MLNVVRELHISHIEHVFVGTHHLAIFIRTGDWNVRHSGAMLVLVGCRVDLLVLRRLVSAELGRSTRVAGAAKVVCCRVVRSEEGSVKHKNLMEQHF